MMGMMGTMDRAMIQRHLTEAERHVSLGAEHIERQREIITELDRDGHDSDLARQLLRVFEEVEATHIVSVQAGRRLSPAADAID